METRGGTVSQRLLAGPIELEAGVKKAIRAVVDKPSLTAVRLSAEVSSLSALSLETLLLGLLSRTHVRIMSHNSPSHMPLVQDKGATLHVAKVGGTHQHSGFSDIGLWPEVGIPA
jgi:hypothetical protein